MPLTVLQIAALAPLDKSYRKADEKGLWTCNGFPFTTFADIDVAFIAEFLSAAIPATEEVLACQFKLNIEIILPLAPAAPETPPSPCPSAG